ncbi:hypothetical protein [Yersinia phage fHe-Yen9-04]|uniref:Uncharacterized protein n=1 Tax=Yersinia phage fHe-Yen9-04 TaxID=2052742 RepID=A0A2C9CXT0_9CAUD|nr:hypothetical protein FDJ41_gp451 [Yersinia phage fHe-Yen9-04]SOK58729.1 hypothetical protein [Yersinia phage fHe-Yen9-04]VUE36498.1 hypothetical protein [Yersinia phage fHe-Yen9-04]
MLNKEQYITVKNTWKLEKEHNIFDHVVYNVIRGLPSDNGFAPITDKGKLQANNNDPYNMYNYAVLELHYELNEKRYNYEKTVQHYSKLFGIEFTPELIEVVLTLIKVK